VSGGIAGCRMAPRFSDARGRRNGDCCARGAQQAAPKPPLSEPSLSADGFASGRLLIAGSTVRVPSIRIEGVHGDDMEGHPRPVDVAVEQPLGEDGQGRDAQLERAVSTLLAQTGGAH
jgi:hypothetical protein